MKTVNIYGILPEKKEAYFKNTKKNFEISSAFKYLAGKAELGSTRSERGYQLVASTTAGQLARALRCNDDKAEALSMAVGLCFPKYGNAGFDAVKQYILEHNLNQDLNTLPVDMIEFTMAHDLNLLIARDFDELLREYFSGGDKDAEVRIVRFVQDSIRQVKKAERFYDGQPGDLLNQVMKEVVEQAEESGSLLPSSTLVQYKEQIASVQLPELTETERKEVFEKLDQYIDEFCNQEYDWKTEKESPEQAVYIYMNMEV